MHTILCVCMCVYTHLFTIDKMGCIEHFSWKFCASLCIKNYNLDFKVLWVFEALTTYSYFYLLKSYSDMCSYNSSLKF